MRRVVSLAATAALVATFASAGPAAADPAGYTSTVTVECDGGTPGINVTGNLYLNFGAKNEKLLYVNGDKMFVFWGVTCPAGSSDPVSISLITKFAPTDVVVGWTLPTICGAIEPFAIPMDSINPAHACFSGRTFRVTIPAAIKN